MSGRHPNPKILEATAMNWFQRCVARGMMRMVRTCKRVGRFLHCRVRPKGQFDPRSFRTITLKRGVKAVIGCPKGKFDPKRKKCRAGTRIQKFLRQPR